MEKPHYFGIVRISQGMVNVRERHTVRDHFFNAKIRIRTTISRISTLAPMISGHQFVLFAGAGAAGDGAAAGGICTEGGTMGGILYDGGVTEPGITFGPPTEPGITLGPATEPGITVGPATAGGE